MNEILRDAKLARRRLKTLSPETETENGRWLWENRRMLLSFLSGLKPALRGADGETLKALRRDCRGFFAEGREASEAGIADWFGKTDRGLTYVSGLPSALFAEGSVLASSGENAKEIVSRLYALKRVDFSSLYFPLCRVERELAALPELAFAKSDEKTKSYYRRRLLSFAKKKKLSPVEAACLLEESGAEVLQPPKPRFGWLLLALFVLAAVAGAGALAYCAVGTWIGRGNPLLFWALTLLLSRVFSLPAFALLRPLLYRVSRRLYPPAFLPSLEIDSPEFVPPKTLVVVSFLLGAPEEIAALERKLSILSASAKGAGVVLLADQPGANSPETPEDPARLGALRRLISRLNQDGGGFAYALRPRVFSPTEGNYTGFERKRGAVEALADYLSDGASVFEETGGDRSVFSNVEYLLLLDEDAALPFGTLSKLLAVAEHPANRDFGCFTPRVESGRAREKTRFAAVYTGGGLTAYADGISDFYMDVFRRGVFCGKGLIRLKAYREKVSGAVAPGRVLSHDFLEGALLSTAAVAAADLTEDFPPSPAAFFSRFHRWARGDTQNLYYLFHRLGKKRLPLLARFQLVDNVLRALTPAATLFTLVLAVFTVKPLLPFMLLLSLGALLADPLLAFFDVWLRQGAVRYFSRAFPAGVRELLRGALDLCLLPYAAGTGLDAVLRGLWRSVRKKKTLEWTTAGAAAGLRPPLFFSLVLPLLSAFVLLLGAGAVRLPALFFLFGVPVAFGALSGKPRRRKALSPEQRRTLSGWAGAIWGYFEDCVTAENRFLPPDNLQQLPTAELSRRTSPTNIGLYLACLPSAADLGLIGSEEMLKRAALTLDTVEKLETHKGLLYNWYSTADLSVLYPRFLSSVDCGNFLVCLEVLRAGVLAHGAPKALVSRIDRLLGTADLSFLYDRRRRLFFVGYDGIKGKFTDACYETFLSETLLTSFYAAAKGIVPASHLSRLRRDVYVKGGRLFPTSFSGTFFEYYMPALFLPLYENTYRSEALLSCLAENKRERAGRRLPWGKSESAAYVFNDAMHYAYRANGVRRLSLGGDANDERVYAPYAAFLALAVDPAGAMADLSAFAALGAYGKYGFYEAVDFEDRGAREDYLIVRSFMAHHLGMSFLAAANALREGVVTRRFLSRPALSAVCSVLEEKVPAPNVSPPPRVKKVPSPQKTAERPPEKKQRGEASLYTDEDGAVLFDGTFPRWLLSGREAFSPGSLQILVKADGGIFRLTPDDPAQTAVLGEKETVSLSVKSAAALLRGDGVLALPVRLRAKKAASAELAFGFVPRLLPALTEDPHRAFSDMGLRIRPMPDVSAVLFCRVGEDLCFAAGFADGAPFVFETDRERLQTEKDFFSPFSNVASAAVPGFALRIAVDLSAGQTVERVLLLCPGADRAEALSRLSALRRKKLPPLSRCAPDGLDREGGAIVSALLGQTPDVGRPFENSAPPSALWERGVSGDWPLIRANADALGTAGCEKLLRLNSRLRLSGLRTDLLLFTEEDGGYPDEGAKKMTALIRRVAPSAAIGRSPGVFYLPKNAVSPAFLNAAASARGVSLPEEKRREAAKEETLLSVSSPCPAETVPVPGGWVIGKPTPRPWGMTYANPVFGTLLTNRGLGFSWALNSRLNALTAGSTDIASPPNGERLLLRTAKGTYDLLSGAAAYFYHDGALFLSRAEGLDFRVAVGVFKKGCGKRVRVTVSGRPTGRETLICEVRPQMAETRRASFFVRRVEGEGLVFTNPANTRYPGFFGVFAENGEAAAKGEKGSVSVRLTDAGTTDFFFVFSRSRAGLEKLLAAGKAQPLFSGVGAPDPAAKGLPESLSLLPHQTVDTRILARCFLSQNSGAYGFRDQLQDCMNALPFAPHLLQRQLLRCASAQFIEGDVLHWFHAVPSPSPRRLGVRTRCRDDLLWLPLALAEYVERTGDAALAGVRVRYLSGDPLSPGQRESYGEWFPGDEKETLFAHACRALENGLSSRGAHGLPLFGACDWNDAFSEMDEGESVWLGMFLVLTLTRFSSLCARLGEMLRAEGSLAEAQSLRKTVRQTAFNGKYFLRGFYPDGAPLGDEGADACAIDLLPQAFAVFAGIGSSEERRRALKAAFDRLYDPRLGLTRLFFPPFTEKTRRAGYINDYPAGTRENGGQYAHAAVWFSLALKKEGMLKEAQAVLNGVRPDLKDTAAYKNEPYYVSGDVLAPPSPGGLGGWSGYTGAAGWLWRALREEGKQGAQG